MSDLGRDGQVGALNLKAQEKIIMVNFWCSMFLADLIFSLAILIFGILSFAVPQLILRLAEH